MYKRPHDILGIRVAQSGRAIYALNALFMEVNPARIIEIGTHLGGLSTFLGLYGRSTGAEVHTIDIIDKRVDPSLLDFLGVHFHLTDVFDVERSLASQIQGDGVTVVLCDGGNKPKEFQTFAPYLKPGDVICGHDYCPKRGVPNKYWAPATEIADEDAAGLEGLEKFRDNSMRAAAWLCMRRVPCT